MGRNHQLLVNRSNTTYASVCLTQNSSVFKIACTQQQKKTHNKTTHKKYDRNLTNELVNALLKFRSQLNFVKSERYAHTQTQRTLTQRRNNECASFSTARKQQTFNIEWTHQQHTNVVEIKLCTRCL